MRVYLNVASVPDSWRYRRSEWGLAVCMVGWGTVLFIPGDTFDVQSFVIMATWASENTWAIGCTILGGTRIGVLVVNGRWRRCSHARAVTAGLSCFFWAAVWLGMFLSTTSSPGLVVYLVFMVMDMQVVYEAMGDARRVDEAHNGSS
jgi:hypothetical protein